MTSRYAAAVPNLLAPAYLVTGRMRRSRRPSARGSAPASSAERFAERCAALAALGIEHAVALTAGPWTEDAVARLAAGQSVDS